MSPSSDPARGSNLADLLYWVVIAGVFVWLLGPPADWIGGRPPVDPVPREVAVAESLRLDAERRLRAIRASGGGGAPACSAVPSPWERGDMFAWDSLASGAGLAMGER